MDRDTNELCECGQPLLDEADGRNVRLGDDRFPFSRSTDFVVCAACGRQTPVQTIHPDAGAALEALRELSRPEGEELPDDVPVHRRD